MSEAGVKGRALERAVQWIESTILRSSPSLSQEPFKIEMRKIVDAKGVRHEIDVWVEIDHGSGYASTFIFECKNTVKPVSKNDVIVFSEKIDAISAQRGFIVGQSFSRDATAQSVKDPRIQLLTVEADFEDEWLEESGFHHLFNELVHVDARFEERGASEGSRKIVLDLEKTSSVLKGNAIVLKEHFLQLAKQAMEEKANTIPSGTMPAGKYEHTTEAVATYGPGELIVDGRECETIKVVVKFNAHILRPAIVSRYHVKSRGRVREWEEIEFPGIKARIIMVEYERREPEV